MLMNTVKKKFSKFLLVLFSSPRTWKKIFWLNHYMDRISCLSSFKFSFCRFWYHFLLRCRTLKKWIVFIFDHRYLSDQWFLFQKFNRPGKKLPIELNQNADESYSKWNGLGIQIVLNSLIFVLIGIALDAFLVKRNCSGLKCWQLIFHGRN